MEDREVLLQEYNNLWNEKLIHKESIRKFHNYLAYITAIGSLSLTFTGISAQDLLTNSKSFSNVIFLIFIPLTPIIIIIFSFIVNDMFHIYAIGIQIGQVECKINTISRNDKLLVWEHSICGAVYGREKINGFDDRITNLIFEGIGMLLIPSTVIICVASTYLSVGYLYSKPDLRLFLYLYSFVVTYMVVVMGHIVYKLIKYTGSNSMLSKVIQCQNNDSIKKVLLEQSNNNQSKGIYRKNRLNIF